MPTLTIDNRSVTVADGSSVLQAAEALGIVVPHLCWHEKLGAVGACRLCAVHVEAEKVRGIHMSCLLAAEEGMVVSTLHPDAQATRRHVIEWLMLGHPHDCPVCDEGGECQLQEMTIAAGHSVRRYRGRKPTTALQELGPFIVQEMNRCIRCYRCVRAYRDYFGGRDFGVFGSRQRVAFGRFKPGKLESPFSGNLAEICPTGVFTDRTWRFTSRNWDLQQAVSVCPHCGVGCATIPGARYRELQRVRAGHNPALNDGFICDRGRFGKGYENRPDRPRHARVDNQPLPLRQVIQTLQQRLDALRQSRGPTSIAWLASPRAGLETLALLHLAAAERGETVVYSAHPRRDRAARAAARIPAEMRRTLAEIRNSDLLVLVGCAPLQEAPMLAAAIRQAQRAGAEVAVIDPRPLDLPCPARHVPLPPQRLTTAIESLGGEGGVEPDIHAEIFLTRLRLRLVEAKRPVLIGGADLLGAAGIDALLQAAKRLARHNRPCGLYVALPGANSFAGGLLAGAGADFGRLLEKIELGEVQALVCVEADPLGESHDRPRTAAALQRLKLLAAADYLPSAAALSADLFIPTTAPYESAMALVNSSGQAQALAPVMTPGEPLRQTGGGDHPPRQFVDSAPGSEPLPAAAALARLFGWPEASQELRARLAAADPRLTGIEALQPGDGGVPLPPSTAFLPAPVDAGDGLQLLIAPALFTATPLTRCSAPLAALPGREPRVLLAPATAAELGLQAGGRAQLIADATVQAVEVEIDAGVARGTVFFSGDGDVPWTPGDAPRPCTLTGEVPR